jgi:hypothetical protein
MAFYRFLNSDYSNFSKEEDNELDVEHLTDTEKTVNVVRYGKSYLKKGTPEYKKWRDRNNQSIILSRNKKKKEEDERKRKLEVLKEENRNMVEKQISIYNELKCLQVIYSSLNNGVQMPINLNIYDQIYKELLDFKKELNNEDKSSNENSN